MKQAALSLLVALAIISNAQAQCAKYEPADGKAILIIGQDKGATGGLAAPNNDGYIEHIGIVPGGITTYASTTLATNAGIGYTTNYGAGDICAKCYSDDETFDQSVYTVGLYMVDDLTNVANGSRDDKIDALADWIKSIAPSPVFLRVGYEFEYQYQCCAADYVAAYKYVVDRCRAHHQLDNVAYVWQSADGRGDPNWLYTWYPGDDYVDWFGYSHFFTNTFNPAGNSMVAMARSKGKPIMVSEAMYRGHDMASENGNSIWDGYFAPLFDYIRSNSDVIKGLSYINQDWESQWLWAGDGWGNSRIQDNETVMNKWITEISSDFWLNASPVLFDVLSCGDAGLSVYAGADETVYLPENSTALTASAGGGDGAYTYNWAQTAGASGTSLSGTSGAVLSISNLSAGSYEFTVTVTDGNGDQATDAVAVDVLDVAQTPYNGSAQDIPGTIETEFYDEGGQGVSYNDVTGGNEGGELRDDDVDVATTSGNATDLTVGWTANGEWLEYTVDVATTGLYRVTFSIAAPTQGGGGTLHLDMDGTDITGSVTIPTTGSWTTYDDVVIEGVSLTAGNNQILRLTFDQAAYNIEHMVFELIDDTVTPAVEQIVPFPAFVRLNNTLSFMQSFRAATVYDLAGRAVIQTANSKAIELSGVPTGIYALQIDGARRKVVVW